MEEIPAKILSLLSEIEKLNSSCPKKLKKITNLVEETGDLPTTLKELDQLRGDLYKIDVRLADCYQMLRSYQKAMIIEDDVPPEEEVDFESHESGPYEYDRSMQEQVKKKVTDEAVALMKEQMEKMTSSWEASKASTDYAQNLAMSQLPPDVLSQMTGEQSGQAEIMKSMMEKMMSGQGGNTSKGNK